MNPIHALVSSLLIAAVGAAQDTGPARALDLDYLLDWESVSSPRLSPAGGEIVYTRSWVDKIHDRRESALWIMGTDGSRQRFLCKGSSPRWSPDGTRLAFLAAGQPKGSQVHVMWIGTREVTQVTRVDGSPSNLRWSPDGEQLAFTMVVPEKQDVLKIKLPKRPEGAKWAPEAQDHHASQLPPRSEWLSAAGLPPPLRGGRHRWD